MSVLLQEVTHLSPSVKMDSENVKHVCTAMPKMANFNLFHAKHMQSFIDLFACTRKYVSFSQHAGHIIILFLTWNKYNMY